MNFDEAWALTSANEGGFQSDASDPGNWTLGQAGRGRLLGTKFGISAAAFPDVDIQGLTLERAAQLAHDHYWGPAGCDAVPDAIRGSLFDTAFNSGVKAAVKLLQQAVGEPQDGILGPHTLQAIQSMDPLRLVARFGGARLLYLSGLADWPAYSRGWVVREARALLGA